MSDTYGIQAIPFAVVENFPAGDVGLGHFGLFLQAAINESCQTIFDEYCPGREPAEFVNFHDPTKSFDESRLPALYVWRGRDKREWMAADIERKLSRIEIGWIAEPSQPAHLAIRDPLTNAIRDAVARAVFKKRCPSYVVTGDTEAVAATRGSLITTFTGFAKFAMSDGEPKSFNFDRVDGDGKPLPYYGFTFGVDVEEQLTIDPSILETPAAIAESLTSNGIAWSQLNDPEPIPEGD